MKLVEVESEKFNGEALSCDLGVPFPQETDSDTSNDLNPLDIDLVIRKVFDFLDLTALLSARSVCRRWNYNGATVLHKRCSKLKIIFTDDQWDKTKTFGLDKMRDFVKFVNETEECPFEIFDIGTSILIEKGNDRTVLKFIAFCGQYIKELIVRDDWDDWELLDEGTHNKEIPECLHFHHLQKLSIHLVGDSGSDRLELFYRIMIGSPKLEHLCIRTTKMDDGEAVEWLIKALENCSCKIKTLEIFAPIQEAQILSLGTAELNLKSLSLDFWGSHISEPDILKNFLFSQSKTLKLLKLSDKVRSFPCAIQFPYMEQLVTLKIKGSNLGSIAMSFPSVSYTDQFPKLKSLGFSTLSGEWDSFLRADTRPSLTVEELKLPCSVGGYSSDGRCIRYVAYLFPNLKKLEIPHYKFLLEVVFEQMTQLEELVIITNEVTLMDEIITGIPHPHKICETMNEIDCYNVMPNPLKFFQKSPSIVSLKSLKTFKLKCKVDLKPVEITDVSCCLGLFLMNSLKCLDFGRRPMKFSPGCLRDMRKRYNVI